MKNSLEKPSTPGVTIEEKSTNKHPETVFTPPIKHNEKEHQDSETGKTVGKDGEEFEVVKTEEMPAEPHEHGASAPSVNSGSGSSPSIIS